MSNNDEQGWYSFLSEFRSLSSSLSVRLASISTQTNLNGQKNILNDAEQINDDIQTLFTTIEPELRHYPYALRQKATTQLKECRETYDKQNIILRRYATQLNNNKLVVKEDDTGNNYNDRRSFAVGIGADSGATSTYADQRSMLLDGRDMLHEGHDSLDNTNRMLIDTAQLGAQTTQTLITQREQFVNQRETLEETSSVLDRSRQTLKRMSRRVVTNKLISGAIILLLLGVFFLIAYLKYFR
jgi:vesicle transport through interaction with t-SNAREs protein 1